MPALLDPLVYWKHDADVTESKGRRELYLLRWDRMCFFGRIGFIEDGTGQLYGLVSE